MPCLLEDSQDRKNCLLCSGCLTVTVGLLTAIFVPLSLSSLHYYEYGLVKSRTTSKVCTDRVYTNGRHVLGPTKGFLTYPADAHHEDFREISVFSAGNTNSSVGLSFVLDVYITYFLKEDEIGLLHAQMAGTYRDKIRAETEPSIKNEAATVTFEEYFRQRPSVERRLAQAVQKTWDERDLHCQLDHLFLGRIRITDQVAQKQLDARIQNEINQREENLQQAEVERQRTAVQVNSIQLEAQQVLATARAEANAIRERATTRARQIEAEAQTNGTQALFVASKISSQEHMTAFTYMRTLAERGDVNLSVNYLDASSVLRTQAVN